jgi:hypothetical protein
LTSKPRQPLSIRPAPAPPPADGPVRRVRTALLVLFPQTPERAASQPGSAPGYAGAAGLAGQPALYAAIQVAAVFVGTFVLMLRVAGVPAWESVYAEDQGVFLPDAIAHPWHLLVPYGGYEELLPRLVGQLVSYLPLVDVAVPFAVAGAGVAALCALFIYHALDGWIGSPWLRALVGAALILLPLAPIEIADCTVGCPWYLMAALFFGLLWRPKSWAGMTAVALIAFAASSSEPFTLVYAPLVLLRVVALPRWREHAVTAGWLAGLLVQVPVVLESYAQHTQRVTGLAGPLQTLGFYFHNVALRAFGWKVFLSLVRIAGLNGATVIVCIVLAILFGWVLVTGSRQVRVFAALALIMGIVQPVFAATVVPYVIGQHSTYDFEGGSRYSTVPIMAMTAAGVVAFDAYLRRQGFAESRDKAALIRQSPWAVIAVTVLACALAIGWLPDFRYISGHNHWGHWQLRAEKLLDACKHSTSGQVTTWTWGHSTINLPCSGLHK